MYILPNKSKATIYESAHYIIHAFLNSLYAKFLAYTYRLFTRKILQMNLYISNSIFLSKKCNIVVSLSKKLFNALSK